jgi:hypothetical protein
LPGRLCSRCRLSISDPILLPGIMMPAGVYRRRPCACMKRCARLLGVRHPPIVPISEMTMNSH